MRNKTLPYYSVVLPLLVIMLCCAACGKKEVDVKLQVDFAYAVQDSNYNAPVQVNLYNRCEGAQFYKWTFVNGTPSESNYKDPGFVIFDKPGPITIKLEAWNDYERKEKIIQLLLDTVPASRFTATARINNISPVDWDFDFTGEGATRYEWSFEGGSPSTSAERNPRQIHYDIPGQYRVRLKIFNDRGRTDTTSKLVTVFPPLNTSFDIEPSFEDDDYEAPLTARLANHTIGSTQHNWQCTGAVFSNASDSIPTVTFSSPGDYTVTYTASNGKQTQIITRTIHVLPNSGLRTFQNIKLGINSAHTGTGSFFSTYLRKVFRKDSVNSSNGPRIDICFFGLSESFNFNKFISPAEAQLWTFPVIPGATSTVFINKQESCGCSTVLSAASFDAITNGTAFDGIPVTASGNTNDDFTNTLVPRIVVFRNSSGMKGAIKIKQYVVNGDDSYIICDIKVQKN